MKKKVKQISKAIYSTTVLTGLYFIPTFITTIHAESCSSLWMSNVDDAEAFELGTAIDCIAGNTFSIAAKVTVGLAILFTLITIFKTIISQGNAKAMEEIPTKWKHTILLVLLASGGGAIINIAFKFLGFEPLNILWQRTWGHLINLLNGG